MTGQERVTDDALPGLYRSADAAAARAQREYFVSISCYLLLLVAAAAVSFLGDTGSEGAIISTVLFLVTLGILIFLKAKRPDDTWYNGRAVAESVKTRSWRWMMRAEPYGDCTNLDEISKRFRQDIAAILDHNRNLAGDLSPDEAGNSPITNEMQRIRSLSVQERIDVYKRERIRDQEIWYTRKSKYNKNRASRWFWVSVGLHCTAIFLLLLRVRDPSFTLPVAVIATAAGAVLTWLQSKKHNELNSSYSLAAHEIGLVSIDGLDVKNEDEFSEFVVSAESAFSREHTQWVARKSN